MAYTVPTTAVPGTIITASDHNISVRDNIIYLKEHEVPTGAMLPFGGTAAPTGWLLCDGSAVSRTGYAALFATVGTAYGVGNGSTTFNVPDCRGRVALGAGTGSGLTARSNGQSGGEEDHTLDITELTTHSHDVGAHIHDLKTFNYDTPSSGSPAFPMINQVGGSTGSLTTEGASGTTVTADAGSSTPFNVMDPFLVFTMIIKT